MPRPRMKRNIAFNAGVTYFKPQGIPMRELEEVTLTREEIEALRLINIENLSQKEASIKMNISQSTLFRELKDARKKLTKALIEGKAIKLEK